MAVLMDAQGLHKGYAGKTLLDGVNLAITDQMKLGLVGANGAGKTTLLRILLGEEEPDLGQVITSNELQLGNLPQHDPFTPEETVSAFLERWSEQAPWTCAALAARFGIGPELLDAPLGSCSGGWRTRAKLCAVLLRQPNLLILDEPTNFLDLRTQLLLEDFLASWSGAALVVSHDRPFLQATCTHTAELNGGALRLHPGPIEQALSAWAEEEERLGRQAENMQTKAKQLQRFVDRNRAGANTASQARSKAKQLARLKDDIPVLPGVSAPRATVRVPQVERRDGPACHIDDLAVGYGSAIVAACPHLEIQRGERLAIMGDNGQGKTTFLRTLAADLPPLRGGLRWTHGAKLAIYGQHVYQGLGDRGTVHDHLSAMAGMDASSQEVLDIAGAFLFRGDEVHKPLGVCSGGERARAVLAGILLTRATVLILDEPTNHLDVPTVDSLGQALRSYGGTVLLASHDRRFVEGLCSGIIEVGDGVIQRWPGEVAHYCQHLRQAMDGGKTPSGGGGNGGGKAAPGQAKKRRQAAKALASCERQLARLEEELQQLETQLASASDPAQAQDLATRQARCQTDRNSAEEQWLQLSSDLEALQD